MPRPKGFTTPPEVRKKISRGNRGQKRSAETKANISAGLVAFYERERAARKTEPDKKRCTQCKKWKTVAAFSPKREKLKSGGVAIRPASACKVCSAARQRAYKARLAAEGVDLKARQAVYDAKRDRERDRERARERSQAERREAGVKQVSPRVLPREQDIGGSAPRVPVGPLSGFLKVVAAGTPLTALERLTGVHERQLRGIINADHPTVTLRVADTIITALGQPEQFPILYPDRSVGYHHIPAAELAA